MKADIPEPLLALWLVEEAERRDGLLVHIARSDARLARLLGPAHAFAGEAVEILPLPAWDVLPYDPARPSAAVVGQRLATLFALARPATRPRLVLTSADAVLQRVPPPGTWDGAAFELRVAEALDPEELRHRLAALGHRADEEIHEPGEAALRGEVVDLWPADATEPVRLDVADGRIAAMRHFDPLSQRSTGTVDAVRLLPAIEFPPDEEEASHLLRAEDEAPPPEAAALLAHARLRLIAGSRGIVTVEAGPKAIAVTFRKDFEASLIRLAASLGGKRMNDRVIMGANEAPLICVLEEYLPI